MSIRQSYLLPGYCRESVAGCDIRQGVSCGHRLRRAILPQLLISPAPQPPMTHRPVHAANLPKPVGPYSPGMGFERLVFVSGQGATNPATGKVMSADPGEQTE